MHEEETSIGKLDGLLELRSWLATLRSELGLSGSEAHLSLGLVSTNFVVNLSVTVCCAPCPHFPFHYLKTGHN